MTTPLAVKLEAFDEHAPDALKDLVGFLREHGDEIVCVARARHITGHFAHGDHGLRDVSDPALAAEVIKELADALIYRTERLRRLGQP